MINRIFFIFILISSTITSIAQKEDYRWMLGSPDGTPFNQSYFGGMDLDFNKGELKIIINHKPYYMNSHNASICDQYGEILFYTDGCFLVDKNNNKIPGSDSLNPIYDYFENCSKESRLFPGGLEPPQGGIILPKPGSNSKYFYFSLETYLGPKFPFSPHVLLTEVEHVDSLIQLKVLVKNKPILVDTLPRGSITSLKMDHDLGWWIILRRNRNNVFNIVSIRKDSITLEAQQIGDYFQYGDLAATSFSPNGKYYACYSSSYGLEILDFDRKNGIFSNYRKIPVLDTLAPGICGVCFSPDNSLIYVSTSTDLFQYNITATDIKASEIHISTTNFVSCDPGLKRKSTFGPMVLGPDCRIYMVSNYQQACMNVIMNPNQMGSACNFVQQAIRFPFLNHSSIPNFPHFRIDDPYPCDSTIRFSLTQIDEYDFSSGLFCYPNPIQDQLTIVLPHSLDIKSYLSVVDITGRVIQYQILPQSISEIKVDCSGLNTGIYFIQIRSDNGAYAGLKFVKD